MLKLHKLLVVSGVVVFSAMLGLLYQIKAIPKIGYVDTQALVSIYAKKLANNYPTGQLPNDELLKVAEHIKRTIARYAKEHNLILLAKGAVWGGELIDYSNQIGSIIMDGRSYDH